MPVMGEGDSPGPRSGLGPGSRSGTGPGDHPKADPGPCGRAGADRAPLIAGMYRSRPHGGPHRVTRLITPAVRPRRAPSGQERQARPPARIRHPFACTAAESFFRTRNPGPAEGRPMDLLVYTFLVFSDRPHSHDQRVPGGLAGRPLCTPKPPGARPAAHPLARPSFRFRTSNCNPGSPDQWHRPCRVRPPPRHGTGLSAARSAGPERGRVSGA